MVTVARVETGLAGLFPGKPATGHFQVEDLEHGGAGHPIQFHGFAANVVRHGPAGAVGPQRQGNPGFFAGHHMGGVGTVTGRINRFVRCLQPAVYGNGTPRPQFKAGVLGQFAVGMDTDGHQHHVGTQGGIRTK